ncbi:hypothetical protein FVE85_4185 [Porphyridium purpureum]|uniref:Uncharacterized protein n=1 Tax=Porphyridium purpureum TaxID=35688 RepID=A0A5J4YTF4_PORPP|nr:hypothetical protein FVE85_4185 [Porphyridium purpureum]|eukprot:POR7531..scf229_5
MDGEEGAKDAAGAVSTLPPLLRDEPRAVMGTGEDAGTESEPDNMDPRMRFVLVRGLKWYDTEKSIGALCMNPLVGARTQPRDISTVYNVANGKSRGIMVLEFDDGGHVPAGRACTALRKAMASHNDGGSPPSVMLVDDHVAKRELSAVMAGGTGVSSSRGEPSGPAASAKHASNGRSTSQAAPAARAMPLVGATPGLGMAPNAAAFMPMMTPFPNAGGFPRPVAGFPNPYMVPGVAMPMNPFGWPMGQQPPMAGFPPASAQIQSSTQKLVKETSTGTNKAPMSEKSSARPSRSRDHGAERSHDSKAGKPPRRGDEHDRRRERDRSPRHFDERGRDRPRDRERGRNNERQRDTRGPRSPVVDRGRRSRSDSEHSFDSADANPRGSSKRQEHAGGSSEYDSRDGDSRLKTGSKQGPSDLRSIINKRDRRDDRRDPHDERQRKRRRGSRSRNRR